MNSNHVTTCTMIMTTPINHNDDDDDSDDEELSSRTSFLDNHCTINNEMLNDVDLVNTPNTWLPAYGYQIQQHSFNRPSHEDLQANETNLTQHIDFLETIFEETSEELQSDSDRSDGTTHWLGSDSETESVIHITSNQTTSGEQLHCSESECHSIVPEKCRCQSSSGDCYCWCKSSTTSILKENRWTTLPRSLSRSSTSSCSSSLIQFENNERACAVVSPSDSLEDSENEIFSPKEYNSNNENISSYSNIRPYRSFESLDTCEDNQFGNLSNYKKRQFKRDVWQETYDREDYSHGSFEDDNYHHNHPSLDWTSTIDLREIGLESDGREAVLLSLTRSQIGSTSDSPYAKLNIDYGNNTALRIMPTEQRGWSNSKSSDFNFRFTNKSRSVPSLPSDFDELSSSAARNLYYNDIYETSSTTDLFSKFTENFTRVNSVPVNLNLFGSSTSQVSTYDSVNAEHYEMADKSDKMASYQLNTFCNNAESEREEEEEEERAAVKYVNVENEEENSQDIPSAYTAKINNNSENGIKKKTVKIQDRGFDVLTIENNIDAVVDEAIRQLGNQVEEINYSGDNTERVMESIPRIPSVKDRSRRIKNNASYELAQQWEIDEKSLKFLPSSPNVCNSPATRKRVLNNASYELAQQSDYIKGLQLTSRPFQRMNACDELHESSYNEENNTSSYGNNKKYLEDPNNDKYQQDGLLNQIKKNSVGFSICGGLANSSNALGPLIDDEVDFSYLETKVIGNHNKIERELETTVDTNNERKNNIYENEFNDDGLMTMTNEEDKLDECSYSDKMALVAENSKNVNGEGACDADNDRQNLQQIPEMISKEQEKLASVLVDESREKKEGESSQQQQQHQQCIQPTEQSTVHATRVCNHASELNTRSGNSIVGCDLGECGTEREEKKKEVIYEGGDNQLKSQPTLVMLTKSLENDAMVTAPSDASGDDEKKNKRGLGGFLQRFSKFRFSGRSKSPRLESKRSNNIKINTKTSEIQPTSVGKKLEPNYIIIPLHPPEDEANTEEKGQNDSLKSAGVSTDTELNASFISTNGKPPVCTSKPPLPPLQSIRACASSPRTTSTPDSVNSRRRAITDLGNPAIIKMAKARAMQQHHHHQHQYHHHQATNQPKDHPGGLLETDLDAEIQDINEDLIGPSSIDGTSTSDKKTRSLLNLTHTSRQGRENVLLRVPQSPAGFSCDGNSGDHPDYTITGEPINQRPHKSMEFLLDKENLHFIKPPENELQKGMAAERVPSEHELRVQRSLQRLNVPDWYKNSPAARDGFRLKRHSDASQHSGWRSLGSKTTSLSSLSSSSNLRQPNRGLLSSPSPQPVFSRWSTSLLNSTGSSPATSTGSSFNYRQPYLGWRSQERLANPRTPAERLAQGILPQLDAKQKQQQQRSSQQLDVRNSIKEVTSAIVHYVQSGQEVSANGGRSSPRLYGDKDENRSNEELSYTSLRGEGMKLCWMESSFVGSRPVDSPETPMSLTTDKECSGCSAMGMKTCSCVNSANSGLYLDLVASDVSNCPSPSSASYHRETQRYHHRDVPGQDVKEPKGVTMTAAFFRNKPSPGSTTLEDVLDSLLGLPSASRTPSPGSKAGKSCSDLRQDLPESVKREIEIIEKTLMNSERKDRRKSEGSDTMPSSHHFSRNRRVSFDNTAPTDKYVVKCKNNKCTNSTTLADARKVYESCHYCMYLYCSKECRRAHWLQRHRKTCLHSRVGALCRQVFSAAKDDSATLKHISLLAGRGYVAHGRGAVKCFFSSPESAEKFIANGFKDLGELTYVRSSDLLLSEMGADLYTEVMRLCKSYNPDTKMVLYVAICVVKEVPCAEVGGVRWERQLISRCGKIRQDTSQHHQQQSQPQQHHQDVAPPKSISQPVLCNITREMDSPETLVLTSLPQSNDAGEKENTPNKAREIGFANIQRQLKLRGVSLRRHFPQVYKKLCSYVDGSVDKFAPVTIYPIDQASGKSFMCIIMLDAEPERLQLLPTDSSRVKTIDISAIEQE
ncbi:uncharacterized protein [Chelonus insularis]|uniref:uncharacterized protein isoform X2 n=1 Tax=Chelonus insularis TaxID=460826 RepID=UPI00158C94B5|nr:uncharacterized protein LOC118072504 isoform X2 [Chelonus insularis]